MPKVGWIKEGAGLALHTGIDQQAQQAQADGVSGWKVTLLVYLIRSGPFAILSAILLFAIFSLSSVFLTAYEEDRELSRTREASNVILVRSLGQLVKSTDLGNTTSLVILEELRDFTREVKHTHPEQVRMLREILKREAR